MIAAAAIVLKGLMIYSAISLILGLFRPVWVLWFLDRFNRLKVLQVYGLALCFFAILRVLVLKMA